MDLNEFIQQQMELLGPDGRTKVIKLMVQRITDANKGMKSRKSQFFIPGFSKLSKVPESRWKTVLLADDWARRYFWVACVLVCLPKLNDYDNCDPTLLPDDRQSLPGKMAIYALQNRMNEFVMPELPPEPERIEEPQVQETEPAAETEEPLADEAPKANTAAEPLKELKKEAQSEPKPFNPGKATQLLGQISISYNPNYSRPFYNCFIRAELGLNGEIIPIPYDEAKSIFPTLGNFNIYEKSVADTQALASRYEDGSLHLIKWQAGLAQMNYSTNTGELNQTNFKVEASLLKRFEGPACDRKVCTVLQLDGVRELLGSNEPIRLADYGFTASDFYHDEKILLRLDNRYAGPYKVLKEKGMPIIRTATAKSAAYVAQVYVDDGAFNRLLTLPCDRLPFGSQGRTWFSYQGLTAQKEDLMPDALLQEELNRLLKRGGKADVEQAFSNVRLPEEIRAARRERIRHAYDDLMQTNSLLEKHTDMVAEVLKAAAANGDVRFKEVFQHMLTDPDMLRLLPGCAMIAEGTEKASRELERLHGEVERWRALHNRLTTMDELEASCTLLTQREAGMRLMVEALERKKDHLMDEIAGALVQQQLSLAMTSGEDRARARRDRQGVRGRVAFYSNRTAGEVPYAVADTLVQRVAAIRPAYTRNEILNLFICLQQGFLTVLAGAPGTGKTSICTILAHALGLDSFSAEPEAEQLWEEAGDADRFVTVPVERGWTSKRDMIGYYNPLTRSCDKSNRHLFDLLETVDAEAKGTMPEQSLFPALVLLDEANLSPMEYYWADYMAACDSIPSAPPVNIGGGIAFHASTALRFLATINSDATTEPLSPRLVDRAWVIRLPEAREASPVQLGSRHYQPMTADELRQIFGAPETALMDEEAAGALKQLTDFMLEHLDIGISPRVQLAIRGYCAAAAGLFEEENGASPAMAAVDFAAAQKLLPRIQGSGDGFRSELKALGDQLQGLKLVRSAAIVNAMLRRGDAGMQYYSYFA